ncbi:Borealin N terminal-domain-containing protein [Lasiosphaeria miniovina]|uniref:Borealin N terminal-domain-containing protein n=1 Tax=Lasiosphaeria miniovina TaxID=1954250 RepID=A0AA40AJM0_9PEZI|nr:Borealin N terminal-domain-containing protein [Lasiosphaeria miniovina]KAK0717043.1 Borealin N terminal-domain-containing protein [Lasiosphaeria miniovina]
MPPARGRKRKSNQSTVSNDDEHYQQNAPVMATSPQKIPTKTGSPSAADQRHQESPAKKRKLNSSITLAQKQALIDNLQLEITERARKLRANYNIHAQSLRTRIEIRVNRIPLSLRKVKMGELLQKFSAEQQQQHQQQQAQRTAVVAAANAATRGPPVPAKDAVTKRPPLASAPMFASGSVSPMRPAKRLSHEISGGGDKENDFERNIENPKKKTRAGPATELVRNPGQVLSPTSSNSRIQRGGERAQPPPPTPGGRSGIARPVSPTKMGGTSLLSNMVEKSRSTRAAATARKTTTSTTASSANGGGATTTMTTTTTRTRRGATAAAPPPPSRPATRTAQRVSATSESSDGSTSTVVRKRPATAMATHKAAAPAPAPAKRTVMGTIKKGVAAGTSRKAPASKTAPPAASTAGTGRVLRKRA